MREKVTSCTDYSFSYHVEKESLFPSAKAKSSSFSWDTNGRCVYPCWENWSVLGLFISPLPHCSMGCLSEMWCLFKAHSLRFEKSKILRLFNCKFQNSCGCLGTDWASGICYVWRRVFFFKINLPVPGFLFSLYLNITHAFPPKSFCVNFLKEHLQVIIHTFYCLSIIANSAFLASGVKFYVNFPQILCYINNFLFKIQRRHGGKYLQSYLGVLRDRYIPKRFFWNIWMRYITPFLRHEQPWWDSKPEV